MCVCGVYNMWICTYGWCFLFWVGDFIIDVSGGGGVFHFKHYTCQEQLMFFRVKWRVLSLGLSMDADNSYY